MILCFLSEKIIKSMLIVLSLSIMYSSTLLNFFMDPSLGVQDLEVALGMQVHTILGHCIEPI
jgi:hypothetical protein